MVAMLEGGIPVDVRDDAGRSGLLRAAASGQAEMVELLAQHGADLEIRVGYHGETALILASHAGHVQAVRSLIAAGADVNAKSTSGGTALEEAETFERAEVAALLRSARAR